MPTPVTPAPRLPFDRDGRRRYFTLAGHTYRARWSTYDKVWTVRRVDPVTRERLPHHPDSLYGTWADYWHYSSWADLERCVAKGVGPHPPKLRQPTTTSPETP